LCAAHGARHALDVPPGHQGRAAYPAAIAVAGCAGNTLPGKRCTAGHCGCDVLRRGPALYRAVLCGLSGTSVALLSQSTAAARIGGGMKIDQAREQFPALRDKAFLDSAFVSLAPATAVTAIQEFLNIVLPGPARSSTAHHIQLDEMRSKARGQVARLIECGEDEVALVESTSHGLKIAAEALPLKRGDHVVMSDLEFMEVGIPWCQKRDETG